MKVAGITVFCRSGRLMAGLLALALLTAGGARAGDAFGQRNHLVFGFLPIVSTHRLVDRFSPLVDYLSDELDVEIRMETAPDFGEFMRRTATDGRYDILFTAPHLYYIAQRDSGYRAIARVDETGMKAVIAVPAASDVASIDDLRGHTLATTGPLALATLLVREQLALSGVDPDKDLTLVSTPSHNASLLSSYQGTTDASALMLPVYRRASPEVLDNMKIVSETRSVPHIPIAVAPWISDELADRLRRKLLDLKTTPAGQHLLGRLGWPGFTAAQAHDYAHMEWVSTQMQVD